jgi:hypothetical protein
MTGIAQRRLTNAETSNRGWSTTTHASSLYVNCSRQGDRDSRFAVVTGLCQSRSNGAHDGSTRAPRLKPGADRTNPLRG